MSYSNQTPLHQLDSVISETVSHIHDFTKSPTDFTRNRKLNAETTIKTILVPKSNHKYDYAIDFKMACLIIRKYFNKYCMTPYKRLYAEILSYINPVRPDRADKRKAIKIKQALWFVYRVA